MDTQPALSDPFTSVSLPCPRPGRGRSQDPHFWGRKTDRGMNELKRTVYQVVLGAGEKTDRGVDKGGEGLRRRPGQD